MPANDLESVTAAVLAGGLGTRLRSVIADRPKVLAPIAGRPFLAYLLDQLGRAGVRKAVLLIGHQADQVRDAFGAFHSGMRLTYSEEEQPLGTGGAIRLALPQIAGETILLLNGDSYCELDLTAFWHFHRERHARFSLALTQVENAARFGRVVTGPHERIEQFEEKSPTPTAGQINAGIYLVSRTLLEPIPPGRALSLERDLMPQWVTQGQAFGFPAGGRFLDIGIPAAYAEAEQFFSGSTRDHSRKSASSPRPRPVWR
jgi:NDP-sugar pyrophosphorylase family protein